MKFNEPSSINQYFVLTSLQHTFWQFYRDRSIYLGIIKNSKRQVTSSTRDRAWRSGTIALCITKLTELGRHIPNGKPRMSIENGIYVPALTWCDGYKGLVTSLSPCPNILSSLLERSPKCVRCVLIEAM